MKILTIEDTASNTLSINTILESIQEIKNSTEDCQNVRNIKEFNKVINEKVFNVIILDLNLPDSSGVTVISNSVALLQCSKFNKNTPIIVFTAVKDCMVVKEALRIGAFDYLIKGEHSTKDIAQSIRFAIASHNSKQKVGFLKRVFKFFRRK